MGDELIKVDGIAVLMATAKFNRYETSEGRKYLVAPVIAVKEGVLNGELLLGNEFGKHVQSWNGIPLPLSHPLDYAKNPISANTPELIEKQSLGRFYNAQFADNKLKGELWVDVEKCKSIGGDALTVLTRLESGEPLEVSTAYFRDIEDVSGNQDGKAYRGIARNLKPDHLALLPNSIGACSWMDGAGAPRINKEGGDTEKSKKRLNKVAEFVANIMGMDDVDKDAKIEEAIKTLSADIQTEPKKEEMNVDKVKEAVNALIAANVFVEEDRAELEKLDVALLGKMLPKTNAGEEKEKVEEKDEKIVPSTNTGEEKAPEKETETETETETEEEVSAEDVISNIKNPELQAMFSDMVAERRQKKTALVGEMVANKRCAFGKNELEGMEVPMLEKIKSSMSTVDYSGKGTPVINTDDDVIPAAPLVVLAKKEDK